MVVGSRPVLALLAAAVAAAGLLLAGPADPAAQAPDTRSVLFVANNWDGTADIVDPATFAKLGRFDVVPDLQERMLEIYTNPERLGYFLAIRQLVGEGHDQFADDMFSSHDGRFVYISRPSLADVVAIDLGTKRIVWRFPMEGQRADHMAISPDGTRVLVSDSTANKVHEIDTATGKKVGEFPSGDSPHENNYTADGKRIFHASIGLVYTPADQPSADSTKGERYFQIVEAGTNKILKRLVIGDLLREHGFGEYSSAVRPMAIAPDEKIVYMQLSFHHGFIVFDSANDRPLKVVDLPKKTTEPRENYLLDSAHHGLSINPEGTKLCAAGTMDGYAAIVSTKDFTHKLIEPVDKPYWSTNSGDGRYCFVSASGSDEVVVVDYAAERQVTRIPVGDHPQRMRMGVIRRDYLGEALVVATTSVRPVPAALHVVRARVRRGRLELRLRMSSRASGRLRIRYGGTSFRAAIPAARAAKGWTVRRAIRGARSGRVVDVSYPGSARVGADRVRLRIAPRAAGLRRNRLEVGRDGRMMLSGTIARRARGAVLVRLAYVGGGTRVRFLRYRAPIRNGRWAVRALLPTQAARSGGQLSLEYLGDRRARVRGEQLSLRLRPAS